MLKISSLRRLIWKHWNPEMQHMGLRVFSLLISLLITASIFVLNLIIATISEIWFIIVCLRLGHETCNVWAISLIARFMGPKWGPSGTDRTYLTLLDLLTPLCHGNAGSATFIAEGLPFSTSILFPVWAWQAISRRPGGLHGTQLGLMLAPWTLLSGMFCCVLLKNFISKQQVKLPLS